MQDTGSLRMAVVEAEDALLRARDVQARTKDELETVQARVEYELIQAAAGGVKDFGATVGDQQRTLKVLVLGDTRYLQALGAHQAALTAFRDAERAAAEAGARLATALDVRRDEDRKVRARLVEVLGARGDVAEMLGSI